MRFFFPSVGVAPLLPQLDPCSTSPHLILGKGLDLLEEETGLVLGADVSHEAAAVCARSEASRGRGGGGVGGVVWCG